MIYNNIVCNSKIKKKWKKELVFHQNQRNKT